MDIENLAKKIEWLDEERRKDKNKISSLEERLVSAEGENVSLAKQIKELSSEITRLNTVIARVDGFEDSLRQMRVDIKQNSDELNKSIKRREDEAEKMRRAEIRVLENSLAELHKNFDQVSELKRSMSARIEEETRLSRIVDEVRKQIELVRKGEEEYNRTVRLIEDGRRQDSKRLIDLQGEVAAVRKRVDEHRGQLELNSTNLNKFDTRISELAVVETERRETVSQFLESQALRDAERERVWKEWQSRFQLVESQATDIESILQNLDSTHRGVKQSQQIIEELSQKVERRTNEITEMQRLADERFRQEWVTFKADDQKRWTNYTLTMDEQRGESQRQHQRLADTVTHLEDDLQEMHDLISLMNEGTEKRLQSLLALTHEWVSAYERSIGRAR